QPDNGAYVDSLGWLYFKKGDINLAIKTLTQAIGLLKDPVIYEHLGDAWFKLGNNDTALVNWKKSLELNPDNNEIKKTIEKLEKPSQPSGI
ncbi:MAG: tetratricopeptide repeat protein, partial [Candidatus Omnitrophota bacterium]